MSVMYILCIGIDLHNISMHVLYILTWARAWVIPIMCTTHWYAHILCVMCCGYHDINLRYNSCLASEQTEVLCNTCSSRHEFGCHNSLEAASRFWPAPSIVSMTVHIFHD